MNLKTKHLIGGILLAMTTAATCSTVLADNGSQGSGYSSGGNPGAQSRARGNDGMGRGMGPCGQGGQGEGGPDCIMQGGEGKGMGYGRRDRYSSVPGGHGEGRQGYGRGRYNDRGRYSSVPGGRGEGYGRGEGRGRGPAYGRGADDSGYGPGPDYRRGYPGGPEYHRGGQGYGRGGPDYGQGGQGYRGGRDQ